MAKITNVRVLLLFGKHSSSHSTFSLGTCNTLAGHTSILTVNKLPLLLTGRDLKVEYNDLWCDIGKRVILSSCLSHNVCVYHLFICMWK